MAGSGDFRGVRGVQFRGRLRVYVFEVSGAESVEEVCRKVEKTIGAAAAAEEEGGFFLGQHAAGRLRAEQL